LPSPRRPLLQR